VRRPGARRRRVSPSPMGGPAVSLGLTRSGSLGVSGRRQQAELVEAVRRVPMWRVSSAPSVRTRHVIGGWETCSGRTGQWEETR
jgi:hypothetical protein